MQPTLCSVLNIRWFILELFCKGRAPGEVLNLAEGFYLSVRSKAWSAPGNSFYCDPQGKTGEMSETPECSFITLVFSIHTYGLCIITAINGLLLSDDSIQKHKHLETEIWVFGRDSFAVLNQFANRKSWTRVKSLPFGLCDRVANDPRKETV